MTEIAIRTPSDLATWVRSDDRRAQLARALPEDVSIDRFERLTTTALLQRPDLLDADQTSLWFALLEAAKRGLAPDGRQGVINVYRTKVKRGGKEEWIPVAQFLPMIGGVRDELARFGWALRTQVVYASDEFDYDEASDRVTHRRARLGSPRGEIIGAWAQGIRLRDGFRMNLVMDRAQIDEVREKAKGGDRLWDTWYDRACEKTVGHRLAKKLPLDPKERARIDRIIVEQRDPAEELYGPAEISESLPAAASELGAAGEPADPAPAAPPPAPDDEPEPTAAEPEPEAEPAPAPESGEADVQALADAASRYIPPNGKYAAGGQYGPKSLMEIAESGEDGARWLKWALGKISEPPEYAAAIWSFSRVFAPALYQEALARREEP